MRLTSLTRLRPPIRRVAVVDPGSRSLKLLLAQSDFGRLRIRQEELIDLKAEGLVSAEEIKTHLLATLDLWGSPPIALVLPQHLSTSQVIDVPIAPESEVKKLIEDETLRLGGVSDSRIVYDFVRIDNAATNRQQFWVTLCQEGEIRDRVLRLGLEHEDICDVTTTANALIATYRANAPDSLRAILVHMGAQTTVVVIMLAGQGTFATSFQMGGDFFTRALMRERNLSEEAAETIKRSTNLLTGPEADPQFISTMEGWVAELDRQLKEWFERNPGAAANRERFELVASGGGFDQPGLSEYLKRRELSLRPWPVGKTSTLPQPSKGFEVAFGAALQALGHSAQPVSLLPEDYRLAWKKRVGRQRLEFASLMLVGVCVMLFALGTWHNLTLIKNKGALLAKIQAGQDAVEANDALSGDLLVEYEALRPLFAAEQNTLDTLKTLSLLQHSRSNRSCWYVFIADQQSYFTQPLPPASTNKLATTNVIAGSIAPWALPNPFTGSWTMWTNISLAKPGLIAELCIPEEANAAGDSFGQIVKELKHQRLFSIADLLSEDQRRALADPKVVIPDREYVLRLDFAETDFQKSAAAKRPAGSSGRHHRRSSSPPSALDNADNFSPGGK